MKVYLWGQIRIGEISLLFMYTTPGYNTIVYLFFLNLLTLIWHVYFVVYVYILTW